MIHSIKCYKISECIYICNNDGRNKCNNKTPLKMIGERCIYSLFINRNKKTIH